MKEYQNINQSLLSESLVDNSILVPTTQQSAYEKAGIFSKLFIWWIYPILDLAYKQKSLEISDIEDLQYDSQSLPLNERFKLIYEGLPQNNSTLIKSLIITFKKELMITFIWIGVAIASQLAVPILIRLILQYIVDEENDIQYAIEIIVAIFIARFVNIVAQSQARLLFRTVGYDAQSAISIEIFNKSLKTSFLSNTSHTSGEVINLMQVDAGKLQYAVFYLGVALLIPVQLVVTLYLMFKFIGVAFFSGFGVLILSALLNALIGKVLLNQQNLLMAAKDLRTKCANQIFSQIKFIKINAFEEYFKKKLYDFREIEVKYLNRRYLSSACIIFSVWLSPLLILNSVFATYVWLGNVLTPGNTFAIISLFQMLQDPLLQLPMAINELLATNVSLKRIQKYFFTKELMAGCIQYDPELEFAVSISNGNFYWNDAPIQETQNQTKVQISDSLNTTDPETTEIPFVLKDININIRKGQLVAIIGDVGSGKSSLLQALAGEMLYKTDQAPPIIQLSGKLAYVSQKYWIQNATVRDNIIFGQEFNEQRYKDAVKYSCLFPDFKILVKGDQTMIGEKGINLSGGQKARISLARALYSDADIYLLDDPISAVDAYVGNYIINNCLNGYLKDKTTLLITHALNNCQYTDYIYLMEDGKIIEEGKFDKIKESSTFKKIYEKFYSQEKQVEENIEDYLDNKPELIKKQSSEHVVQKVNANTDLDDELMIEEDRARGNIAFETYKQYYNSNGGALYFMSLFVIQCSWLFCYLITSYWIAHWSQKASEEPDLDNTYYLKIYFYFGLGQGLFAFMRGVLIVLQSIGSANKIHTKMINCLMYAPQCSFFERVPLGRIINRLTKDQNVLDQEIFWGISWASVAISLLIANTILYVYSSTVYILIPIALYFIVCWAIQRAYMAANRELQRLESITKSPILSFFSESILGVTFIRVFLQKQRFLEKHGCNQDVNRKIFLQSIAANAWFIMMLGLSSLFVNVGAIVYCVFYSDSNPALTGLVLTYASQIDGNISGVIQALGIFENGLVSFERCIAFTQTEPEQGYKALVQDKGYKEDRMESWPSEGTVVYNYYSVKYREDLAPALSDLSFVIAPRDKIGVVGRTGAGKSTVTLTLLRIVEAMKGQIIIDGIDISTLPLKQVRESITMIMQDATIFDGTLRDNIDPLKLRTDDEIMEAIDKCCLNDLVERRNGLDSSISEGGDNLSAGEKQLICIARAVLKRCKIVLIDEATANIDIETEHKIQQTIQTAFKDCTVITIAHRINTILYCDKILVIDAGHKKEFGYTKDLLEDKSSTFYGIYMEALSNQQQGNKN